MKNLFLAAMAVLFIILTGCDTKPSTPLMGPGIHKTVTADTTIIEERPILANRYGCEGQELADPKVMGYTTERKVMTLSTLCGFTHEEITAVGYNYTGKPAARGGRINTPSTENVTPAPIAETGSDSGFPWGWIEWLLGIALLLGLLWLLFWMLSRFATWVTEKKEPNNPPAPTNTSLASAKLVQTKPEDNPDLLRNIEKVDVTVRNIPTVTSTTIADLLKNQGGSFRSYENGQFKLVVNQPTQTSPAAPTESPTKEEGTLDEQQTQ